MTPSALFAAADARRPRHGAARVSRRWLAAAACTLATGGTAAPAAVPTDQALAQAILGAWCNSDDGGRSCWGYDEYLPGGAARSCALPPGSSRPWSGTATYEVKGPFVCLRVTDSTDDSMRPGDRICIQVLEIDARHQRFRYVDSDAEFTLHRRAPADVRCPGVGI